MKITDNIRSKETHVTYSRKGVKKTKNHSKYVDCKMELNCSLDTDNEMVY